MKKDNVTILAMAIIVLIALCLWMGVWVFKSHMEAKSYNRVTGASVSTWDAMWIELRAVEGPKNSE